ncbi:MAG: hemin uptake protein HemP [Telmatospirillum sp.]|nr:hemin uptake protein HemP [Telmatospirillum sp.]
MNENRTRFQASANATTATKRVASVDLFGDAKELVIRHFDVDYRLRITGNGKLLLTK